MDPREEVRRLAEVLADEDAFELVDVEHIVQGGRRTFRVLLDRPGGVTISDCAAFSRRLSDCLDMNQTVPGRYVLEVSSPGIDRPLRTLESFERFAGKRAALVSVEPRDGRRNYEGQVLAPRDERAGIRTDDGEEHWFAWNDVKTARLVGDPWEGHRRAGGAR